MEQKKSDDPPSEPRAESSEEGGNVVPIGASDYRDRIIDQALQNITRRLSLMEQRADARAEADRLQTRLLIDLTKSMTELTAQVANINLTIKLLGHHEQPVD